MPEELDSSPRCAHCGYPLAQLTKSRCPECGNAFDLENPETYCRPTITTERNWTIQELAALLSVGALLALRPRDTGELVIELILEAAALYALALFFAVTNDKFWLTPALFFLALNGICWSVCWRESRLYAVPFFERRLIVLAGAATWRGARGRPPEATPIPLTMIRRPPRMHLRPPPPTRRARRECLPECR